MSAWSSESPTTRQVGQWVGCEDDDGLIVVHPERETCAVCQQASPVSTSAESPANTPVEPAGASEPPSDYIDIVFDGPPASESGRFIEVENAQGASIRVGEWVHRPDGYWALRLPAPVSPVEPTPPRCGARHQMTGVVCELQQGHAENHRGEDSHAIAQWPVEPAPPTPAPCVWRDIASAPKDETPIRLKWAGTTVEAIGRWCPAQVLPSGFGRSNYSDDWRDVEGDDVLLLPTHWKPVIVSGSPLKVER